MFSRTSRVVLLSLLALALLCSAHAVSDPNNLLNSDEPPPPPEKDTSLNLSYKIHGWLMWVAFGLLMPSAVIVAAYMQSVSPLWFHAHWITQSVALALVVASFSLACAKFDAILDSLHSRLGIAVFVFTCAQPALAIFRPSKGSALRVAWFGVHWVMGMTVMLLGWLDLFLGIQLFEENTGIQCQALKIAVAVNVLLFVAAYVVLARWEHLTTAQLQSQAVGNSGAPVKGAAGLAISGTSMCSYADESFACMSTGHGVERSLV